MYSLLCSIMALLCSIMVLFACTCYVLAVIIMAVIIMVPSSGQISIYLSPRGRHQQRAKKQRTAMPPRPRSGWATVNCTTGQAYLGRTTGHNSSARGEWQSIVYTLSIADPDKPLLILTDYFQATLLPIYSKSTIRSSKNLHRDLIWEAIRLLLLRKAWTTICWVKGHAGIQPNVVADKFAKMACSLPFVPPKPDPANPSLWILHALPLVLPTASPLLRFREAHHSEPTASLHLDTINVRLSSLPLYHRPNPKLVAHMHGRVNWNPEVFSFWHEHNTIKTCKLCDSQHATDVFSSLCHCPALAPFASTALCKGYARLAPLITTWHTRASAGDRRNFARHLVPRTLQLHITRHKKLKEFISARKAHPYLTIMVDIRTEAQRLSPQPLNTV